jgi:acyl-CoA synthetase (AMP-forming)/AMP-acid ligase II
VAGDALLTWAEDTRLPDLVRSRLTGPGAPFEMVEEEVLGTKMSVFGRRPRNMREPLEASNKRFGDQPFLIFPERTFSFRNVLGPISAVAAALQDRFGVGPGDRVAIAAANCEGHALTAWAAVCLGATAVELNGWWTGPEMLHGIELSRPKVVLGDQKRLDRIPPGSVAVPMVCFEDDLAALEEAGEGRSLPPNRIDEDDPLCILFTSGTTGRPKGAVLSHRCHAHMMMQAALQGQVGAALEPPSSSSASSSAGYSGGSAGGSAGANAGSSGRGGTQPAAPPTAVSVGVSPMFHISGFSVALIGGAMIGQTIAYPPPGRWDPERQLEMTERLRATAWSLVPTQLWRLLDHPRFEEFDVSSLRRIGGGGATFQPELWRRVRERLPHIERMATGYGMTETCGAGTHQDGKAAREHPEAVGAPVPGYSIAVRRVDGSLAAVGEVGQICLRGPCNFLGYWDNPEATARALDSDRWYHTGEMGHIEYGLLFLDSRGTDLIIRGGENIYPIEIENRLIEHPAVAEAAVIGVPDRVLGEEVEAVVVLKDGACFDDDSMRQWVGEALAAFKVPSRMRVVDDLPHNPAGKVMKHLLRDATRTSGFEEE